MEIPTNIAINYTIDSLLLKGNSRSVFKVRSLLDRKYYCLKHIQNVFKSPQSILNTLREIKILKNLKSSNIIPLKEMCVDGNSANFESVFLITQLMECDFKSIIYSHQSLSLSSVKHICFQIIKAIDFLHKHNVMHRDIKPANILLNSNCKIKLCDFGMAKPYVPSFYNEVTPSQTNTCNVVTKWYRSPEILFQFDDYNMSCDVWSFGCVLAEALLRQPLFRGKNETEQVQLIIDFLGKPSREFIKRIELSVQAIINSSVNFPQNLALFFPMVDSHGVDLFRRIFTYNYNQRISAEEVMKHPFFKEEFDLEQNELEKLIESVDEIEFDLRTFAYENQAFDETLLRSLIFKETGVFY